MVTTLESLAFRVEVECEECWSTIGVPSIVTGVRCACGSVVALGAAFWRKVISSGTIASILEAQDDALQTMRYTSGPVVRFGWGRRVPRCEGCKRTIALEQLVAGAACGCGAALGVREAEELARAIDPRARFVVAPAPSTSRLFYLICAYGDADRREAQWVDQDVRVRDAATDMLTEEQFARLAADEHAAVREAIANNRATPGAILASLVTDRLDAVRLAVARSSSTPLAALEQLAKDRDLDVRKTIARSERATPQLLAMLATDKDSTVRAFVASNDSATPELLAQLATDREADVRRYVAEHAQASAASLMALARDAEYRVRARVARNARAPAEALAILAKDTDSDVAKALRANPVLTPELIEELKRG